MTYEYRCNTKNLKGFATEEPTECPVDGCDDWSFTVDQ